MLPLRTLIMCTHVQATVVSNINLNIFGTHFLHLIFQRTNFLAFLLCEPNLLRFVNANFLYNKLSSLNQILVSFTKGIKGHTYMRQINLHTLNKSSEDV